MTGTALPSRRVVTAREDFGLIPPLQLLVEDVEVALSIRRRASGEETANALTGAIPHGRLIDVSSPRAVLPWALGWRGIRGDH
jgi:hypothetical protein